MTDIFYYLFYIIEKERMKKIICRLIDDDNNCSLQPQALLYTLEKEYKGKEFLSKNLCVYADLRPG